MLDQIARQRLDSAAIDAANATESFNEAQVKVQEGRIAFFEKLALFNSGAIAASVTLATALHQHPPVKHFWLLDSCWSLLLIAMGLCLGRNWSTHSQHYYAALSRYHRKDAEHKTASADYVMLTDANVVGDAGETENRDEYVADLRNRAEEVVLLFQKTEKQSEDAFTRLIFMERGAILLTFLGLIAMLIFTVSNLG